MTLRKQVSMVLPESLIRAIKQRAARRGQSVTAYITRLVEQDLAAMGDDDGDHPPTPHGRAARSPGATSGQARGSRGVEDLQLV